MSAQWIITDGFGGSPGSTKYIVTMGLVPDGVEPIPSIAAGSRTWVGIGVGMILLIMVHVKWN